MEESIISEIVERSHEALMSGSVPAGALSYLTDNRGLNVNYIKLFGIGFCSFELEKLINGVYYDGKSPIAPFPWAVHLRDKIVLPIKDDCDKLIAFATRGIGDGQSWWNVPFIKGNILFGLNLARSACFNLNKVYIVEGYMDQIICFQMGLQNVVAAMGTRFTLAHAGLVLRYCDRMCLCFDADPVTSSGALGAGQRATKRTVKNYGNYFRQITAISLPIGIDPDEFILEHGKTSLLALEGAPKEYEDIANEEGWR